MLQKMREKLLGWVALVIIGLIGITFVFFGVNAPKSVGTDSVAEVNGSKISRQQFDQIFQQQLAQYAQLFGGVVPPEYQTLLGEQILEGLIQQELLTQRMNDRNFVVPDALVAEVIRSISAFQVNGQFSMDTYRQLLASVGYSPALFEQEQRKLLAIDLLERSVTGSSLYTSNELLRYLALSREEREFAWSIFPRASYLDQVVEPSDDDINSYYATFPWEFMQPESVDLEYVALHLNDIAAGIEVDEAGVLDYYQRTVVGAQGGEERRARHILISPDGRTLPQALELAESLRARIAAGEDFAALAREYSADQSSAIVGGDLGWAQRGLYVQPFEDALYALAVGELSAPVETSFGYHLIELQEVREPEVEAFEDIRDTLVEEYRRELAMSDFIDQANGLATAVAELGQDLTTIAQAKGLEVRTISGFTRDGNATAFDNSTPVVSVAFSSQAIDQGRISSLIQTSNSQVLLLRVSAHYLPQQYPLEEVREQILQRLRESAATELAAQAAGRYLERLRAGATPEELQEEFGITMLPAARYTRDSFTGVPSEVLISVFGQPHVAEGQTAYVDVQLADGGYAVYALQAIVPGDPASMDPTELDTQRTSLQDQMGYQDFAMYLRALQKNAKIVRY